MQPYNLIAGASLVSARTVDVLIFLPLIPAFIWFLPWERWKIPNKIIGPYLLYCAFAIWHFKQWSWIVPLFGLLGIAVSASAVFDVRKARTLKRARETKATMLKQARGWPVAEGFVYYVGKNRDSDGALNVTVTYTYKVQDEGFCW